MATGSVTLPAVIVVSVILWIVAELGSGHFLRWQTVGGLLAYAFIIYSLIEVNTVYSFIRTGTSFHTSVFLLMFTAVPSLYVSGIDYLVPCLFIILMGMLFGSFENKNAPGSVFNSFLCLGLTTLLDPYFVCLFPVMLLQLEYLRSLTTRTLVAGIMGLCLPYWFIWGYAAFADDYAFLLARLRALITFSPIDYGSLRLDQYLTYAFVLMVSAVGGHHTYTSSYKEKVHTRLMLHVVIMMQVVLNIMLIVQPSHFNTLMSLQIVLSSILAGYMLSTTFTPFTRIFSYVAVAFWIAVCTLNLWTHFKLY